jgi:hypothetical protein
MVFTLRSQRDAREARLDAEEHVAKAMRPYGVRGGGVRIKLVTFVDGKPWCRDYTWETTGDRPWSAVAEAA